MAELMARAAKKSVSSHRVTRQRGKSRTAKLTEEKEKRGHEESDMIQQGFFFLSFPL